MTILEAAAENVDVAASDSPIGAIAVGVVDGCVAAVSIGQRNAQSAARAVENSIAAMRGRRRLRSPDTENPSPCGRLDAQRAIDAMLRYADGEPDNLSNLPIILWHLTPFQKRVADACRAIPYGCTATYGELARRAGRPAAARAVGRVMATNQVPLLVPCHRVVASSGRLGGFSAPQGVLLKQRLLDLEESSRPALKK